MRRKIRAYTKKITIIWTSSSKFISLYIHTIFQKISSRMVRVATYYAIFLVLVTGIVQPQLLQFHMWESVNPVVASVVFAQQVADEQQDGSLQFENLLTDTWEDNRLVYTVQSWESIWSIAKQFATSTKELLTANDLENANLLRPGQKIIISYAKDQLIYEIEESSSLQMFSEKYELDIDELINLNFFSDSTHFLDVGDQILLDLSIPEAQRKNLYQKPVYETPEELLEPVQEDILMWGDVYKDLDSVDEEELLTQTGEEFSQKIISAEETTNNFDTEEQRLIQEIKNKELAAAQALLDIQAEKERQEEITRSARSVSSNTWWSSSADSSLPSTVPVAPVQQRVIEATSTSSQCGSNKCFYNGKCWNLPAHASCTSQWASEAWSCKSWYKEYGSQCVTNAMYENKKKIEMQKTITKPARKYGIVSQRYFNPSGDGYNNGRARWHCTHGAGRRRWKNYWIMTNRRWNGGKRYYNASAAWRQVWQTPEVWAIFSTKWAAENGRYGHVWVVTQVDRASWSMMVVDMNYVGKATFSQRRVPMKMTWLIWFIYPRKK